MAKSETITFENIDELLEYNEKLLNGFLSYLNKRHDKRRDVIHAGVKTLIWENKDFAKEFNDYVKKGMIQ